MAMTCRCVYRPEFLAILGLFALSCFADAQLPGTIAQSGSAPSQSRLFQSAAANYQSGKFGEAERILRPILAHSPRGFDVNELMGLVLVAQGKDASALPYLRNAARADSTSAPARVAYAGGLLRLGKSAEADAEFKKAAALKPSDYDSNHSLGEFYIRAGRLTEAIPFLERAQAVRPSAYDNGYDLALASLRAGKPREAAEVLKSLMAYKDTAEMRNLLGETEERSGDYLAAARDYGAAARMDPSKDNILDWGVEFLRHHTFQAAVKVFSSGAARYPASVKMRIGLGLAYYGLADFKESAEALMNAADLSPRDPRPYRLLGETYSNSNIPVPGVVERLERWTSMNPTNAKAFYYLALARLKTPSSSPPSPAFRAVESDLQKAAELAPDFADARLQLGNLYSQENRIPEAIAAYREAVRIDPGLADAHYRLAMLYRRMGNEADARRQLASYQKLQQEGLKRYKKEHEQIEQFVVTMGQ